MAFLKLQTWNCVVFPTPFFPFNFAQEIVLLQLNFLITNQWIFQWQLNSLLSGAALVCLYLKGAAPHPTSSPGTLFLTSIWAGIWFSTCLVVFAANSSKCWPRLPVSSPGGLKLMSSDGRWLQLHGALWRSCQLKMLLAASSPCLHPGRGAVTPGCELVSVCVTPFS